MTNEKKGLVFLHGAVGVGVVRNHWALESERIQPLGMCGVVYMPAVAVLPLPAIVPDD